MSSPESVSIDPYTAPSSPELVKVLFESPAVDGLLSDSVREVKETAEGQGQGTLHFAHFALRGPPGRLHGGLHCIARTLLIAAHLDPPWPNDQTFPCAFSVRIGHKIELRNDVPFRYWAGTYPNRRFLVTRFLDTPRLEAALWTLPPDAHAHVQEDLSTRFGQALMEPTRTVTEHVGLRYEHNDAVSLLRFSSEILLEPLNPFRRFLGPSGAFSPTLPSYYLDNLAAASRMEQLKSPCFTTRLGLAFFSGLIPSDRGLLFVADRKRRGPPAGARPRAVEVDGRLHGTETTEVFLADESLTHVYAWGWVDTHPMGDVLSQTR